MALNFPGPYEVRINYTVLGRKHVARLNCNPAAAPAPGTPFSSINCIAKNGTNVGLQSAVEFYVNNWRTQLSTADATIENAELWKYTPGTFQSTFVSSHPLALTGASGAVATPATQLILTLRTVEGGILKATVMENTTLPGDPILPADFSAAIQGWANQFLLDTSIWLGRDTSYAATALKLLPGQNEALFKRIYRQ